MDESLRSGVVSRGRGGAAGWRAAGLVVAIAEAPTASRWFPELMMSKDRKALSREYKETPRTMGVGAIRNTSNGKSFVVAGVNIPALLNRHKAQLRLGMHPNRALQQDFTSHGPDVFEFEILDTLAPPEKASDNSAEELRVLESMWMEKLTPFEPRGYHRKPKARDGTVPG